MPFLLFLKPFWKYIAIALAVVAIYFYIWNQGVQHGKKVCEETHLLLDQKRDAAINEKIDKLASASTDLANTSKIETSKTKAAIHDVVAKAIASKEPLIIYRDERCEPAQKYVDAYNAIVGKANE